MGGIFSARTEGDGGRKEEEETRRTENLLQSGPVRLIQLDQQFPPDRSKLCPEFVIFSDLLIHYVIHQGENVDILAFSLKTGKISHRRRSRVCALVSPPFSIHPSGSVSILTSRCGVGELSSSSSSLRSPSRTSSSRRSNAPAAAVLVLARDRPRTVPNGDLSTDEAEANSSAASSENERGLRIGIEVSKYSFLRHAVDCAAALVRGGYAGSQVKATVIWPFSGEYEKRGIGCDQALGKGTVTGRRCRRTKRSPKLRMSSPVSRSDRVILEYYRVITDLRCLWHAPKV